MKLGARNQLSGAVTSVNEGAAIANVELDVDGQRLVASITVEAARELGWPRARRSRRSSRRRT
jgi:molybdopterin-binding protein